MFLKSSLRAALMCTLAGHAAYASSDAGLDVSYETVRVRVLYSVALDYGRQEAYIRDSRCMLFDVIAFLQNRAPGQELPQRVLQFELYQSSQKAGNFLSLTQDPFEGGDFKVLFDGRAGNHLGKQVMPLLARHLGGAAGGARQKSIKLYRCTDAKACQAILFGSFPSEEMKSRYCPAPGKGCDAAPVAVSRREMRRYFPNIPD